MSPETRNRIKKEKEKCESELYSVHIDDQLIKTQQNKLRQQMDLGIDDLIDGDLVNYFMGDNRPNCKFILFFPNYI